MTAIWQLTFKHTSLHELNALESRSCGQILKKLDLLAADPTPDAKTKEQLRPSTGSWTACASAIAASSMRSRRRS